VADPASAPTRGHKAAERLVFPGRPEAGMPSRAAASVLADRIAAALVHREPGWRLPRRSALARRYNVSAAEIDAAIGELDRRSLIRRLPNGQLYRASPAEYLIPVERADGLTTRLIPLSGEISCLSRHVSQRDAPQDVAWALGLGVEAPVRIVKRVWGFAAAGPAAISTAYVPQAVAELLAGDDHDSFEAMLHSLSAAPAAAASAYAGAAELELTPPQPSVARSLRLVPGQPAVSVTIRFDDRAARTPVGLTVVTLRPDLFRVVVRAGMSSLPEISRHVRFIAGNLMWRCQLRWCQVQGRRRGVPATLFRRNFPGAGKSSLPVLCSFSLSTCCSRSSPSSSRSPSSR
jgi:DNA-binding GntR family transcriptional regulator